MNRDHWAWGLWQGRVDGTHSADSARNLGLERRRHDPTLLQMTLLTGERNRSVGLLNRMDAACNLSGLSLGQAARSVSSSISIEIVVSNPIPKSPKRKDGSFGQKKVHRQLRTALSQKSKGSFAHSCDIFGGLFNKYRKSPNFEDGGVPSWRSQTGRSAVNQ